MPLKEGQDPVSGKFLPGNTLGGRVKGSRNALTKKMLERFAIRNEDGCSVEEILLDIAQDPKGSPELKFKAASKLADMVFPKAQSVELEIEAADNLNPEQIDDRIRQLLNKNGDPDAEA